MLRLTVEIGGGTSLGRRAAMDDPPLAEKAAGDGVAGVPLLLDAERQEAVERVNGDIARPEQIKRFAILSRDFSADEGEITPTLKLRVCMEDFAGEVEALYLAPR